jgi:hypothetical protein
MPQRSAEVTRGSEALPTLGLILNVVAVIGFALCLAGMSMADLTLALVAGPVAIVSFAGSLAVLVQDGKRFAKPGVRRRNRS